MSNPPPRDRSRRVYPPLRVYPYGGFYFRFCHRGKENLQAYRLPDGHLIIACPTCQEAWLRPSDVETSDPFPIDPDPPHHVICNIEMGAHPNDPKLWAAEKVTNWDEIIAYDWDDYDWHYTPYFIKLPGDTEALTLTYYWDSLMRTAATRAQTNEARQLLEQAANDDHLILINTDPTHVADIVHALQTLNFFDTPSQRGLRPEWVVDQFTKLQTGLTAYTNNDTQNGTDNRQT